MVIFKNIKEITKINDSILTLGSFDGLHVGHIKILSELIMLSKSKNIPSVVITFNPHPKMILLKTNNKMKYFLKAHQL